MEDISDEKQPIRGAVDDRDWILQTMAVWANHGYSVGVTLTTPSGLMCGMVCSGKEYVEHIERNLINNFSGDAKQEMTEVFSDWKKPYEVSDDEKNEGEIVFIHLREAKLLVGDKFVPAEGTYWRGRISSISGFALGTMNINPL